MKPMLPVSMFLLAASALPAAEEAAQPFDGSPHPIPGLIEAEHWDKGPAGVAYRDEEEENKGEDYREKTQVDIEKRPDASNGHGIGWTREGEWLVYTVTVKESGTFRIEMPVASKKEGGIFHLEFDGEDKTGPIRIPDTGSWKNLELLIHEGVRLESGTYSMKVVMKKNGESGSIGDIDFFRFVKTADRSGN